MLTYNAANQILSALTGRTSSVSLASSCYVGLSHTNPGRDGQGLSEPPTQYTYTEYDPNTGQVIQTVTRSTGYERQLIGSNSGAEDTRKMSTPSEGRTTSKDIIYFPEVLDVSAVPGLTPETILHPWGTVAYFCIFSSKTGGGLLAYSPIVRWVEGESGEEGHYEPITLSPEVEQLPIIRKGQLQLELE